MIVCCCRAVSEHEVEAAIAQGASSVEAIGQLCGAGTDCGACVDELGARLGGCATACAAGRSGLCSQAGQGRPLLTVVASNHGASQPSARAASQQPTATAA